MELSTNHDSAHVQALPCIHFFINRTLSVLTVRVLVVSGCLPCISKEG